MAKYLALPFLLILLCDFPGAAQYGSPYPPGGMGGGVGSGGIGIPGLGGISLPGARRRNGQNNNVATDTLTGKLHRVSTSQFVITTDDNRDITVGLDRNTKYFDNSGGQARFGDFDIGDQVSIDAGRDTQNYYHAQRVSMVQRAVSNESVSSSSSGSSSDDNPDRPKLKRAGNASSASVASSGSSDNDPDRPILKRNSDSAQQVADVKPVPVPPEADDPGPPKLRHGVPARVDHTPVAGSEPDAAVDSRPSIRAGDANGVTRLPAPPVVGPAEQSSASRIMQGNSSNLTSKDPVIQGAREAAASFTETLPNYVVKQFTTRYQTDSAHGNRTSWQALDVVTSDVVYENGKESYKNILVNGKAPRDAVEKTGSWSTGEFSTILLGILAPQTDADFRGKRSTTIVNRAAYRYDYSVEQPNSSWHVFASAQSYIPGYTGAIWIDKENNRVLRIEMSAKNMPKEFPLDAVESAVDYDYVLIGDQKFLLPVHSEALSCVRGSSDCTRNVIDFRNYKKFGADTTIKFDTDKN